MSTTQGLVVFFPIHFPTHDIQLLLLSFLILSSFKSSFFFMFFFFIFFLHLLNIFKNNSVRRTEQK